MLEWLREHESIYQIVCENVCENMRMDRNMLENTDTISIILYSLYILYVHLKGGIDYQLVAVNFFSKGFLKHQPDHHPKAEDLQPYMGEIFGGLSRCKHL